MYEGFVFMRVSSFWQVESVILTCGSIWYILRVGMGMPRSLCVLFHQSLQSTVASRPAFGGCGFNGLTSDEGRRVNCT